MSRRSHDCARPAWKRTSFLVVAVLALACDVVPAATSGKRWVCAAGECRAGFVLHTFWHDVDGTTTGVTARLESASGDPTADGAVTVSVDAASLVTGIERRDRKMREEHLETARHPKIEFRSTASPARARDDGVGAGGGDAGGRTSSSDRRAASTKHEGGEAPAGGRGPADRDAGGSDHVAGASGALEIHGDLTIHGVTKPVAVRVQAERAGEAWIVHGRFTVKLSEFGIPDPSIILNKVDDAVEAWFEVRLVPEG